MRGTLKMKDKKAAIELSVTAIVILILAIVILGLGLGFIRGMFGKVATQFEQQIAIEPEPPTTSGSDTLTLSRESIITSAGASEVLKVGVYNPTSRDWASIGAWSCANFSYTTEDACEAQRITSVAECSWDPPTQICSGNAASCGSGIFQDSASVCAAQKGCRWDSTATTPCQNVVGIAPLLVCGSMTGEIEAQVNGKIIRQGESTIFNYLMTIPKATPEKTYLCEIIVADFQKDLTIKVTR